MDKQSMRYKEIECLGEGQFASVYKALDTVTETIVAVKQMKAGSGENIRFSVMQSEIELLTRLKHENVIAFFAKFGKRPKMSMVIEYMDTDLDKIIRDRTIVLSPANIKAYMLMLLNGLKFLHMKGIIHRDLKPPNLLVNAAGKLKIADFGLATAYGIPTRIYTDYVVTRWYRAPELLFGVSQYGTAVDIWSVGCIMGEMMQRKPLLRGKCTSDQLEKIFELRGTPTLGSWPNYTKLPKYIKCKRFKGLPLQHTFPEASLDCIDLLDGLLTVYPAERCSCSAALKMEYFSNDPAPVMSKQLPIPKKPKSTDENNAANEEKAVGENEAKCREQT